MNIATAFSRRGTRASNRDQTGETIGERSACFVVCDGIAGLPGGEVAAELARNSIISRFDGDKHLNAQHIRDYVQTANRTILSEQQAVQDYRRMGTTLVSLFIDRDYGTAYWAHAGDSRLYLFRRGWLWHVTTDHSPVQQMKDAGHQTDNLNSNLLYLALGIENGGPEASYSDVVQVEDGDAFLLCTDGFWHGVSEEQMKQSLHMVNTPEEWLTLMNQIIQKNGEQEGMRRITTPPRRYGWATLRTPLCCIPSLMQHNFFPAELIRHTRNDMKLWLSGLALLAVTSTAQAENFRIVQSPAQKLDIWIDNIKDNTPQSWCKPEVALRIVANGKKDVSVLENFVPRLGSLLEHQCSKVNTLSWTLNDPAGTTLAQGTAAKAQEWALVVKQQQATPAVTTTTASGALMPPDQNVATHTVAADRTPWQEFTLQTAVTCAPSGKAAHPHRRSLFRILIPPSAAMAAGSAVTP